jgi:hypothetical protein
VDPVVDSSVALIAVLAAAALGLLFGYRQAGDGADDGARARVVASIAIVGALPILVLGLLLSHAIQLSPR